MPTSGTQGAIISPCMSPAETYTYVARAGVCVGRNGPESVLEWRPHGIQAEAWQEPSATESVDTVRAANALMLVEFGAHPECDDF